MCLARFIAGDETKLALVPLVSSCFDDIFLTAAHKLHSAQDARSRRTVTMWVLPLSQTRGAGSGHFLLFEPLFSQDSAKGVGKVASSLPFR